MESIEKTLSTEQARNLALALSKNAVTQLENMIREEGGRLCIYRGLGKRCTTVVEP